MRFVFHEREGLTCLAWLAKMRKRNPEVEVWSGRTVERREAFFVAGVWDGDFEKGNFARADFACCTGGMLINDKQAGRGVRYATPNHTQEMLYVIINGEELFVSNSAAFLLAKTDNTLDTEYYHYEEDFCSGLFGVSKAKKWLPLAGKKRMFLFRCCNILIDQELKITEEKKVQPKGFYDFASYRHYVKDVLEKIRQNAASVQRKQIYGMLSTISRGYDAPASCVLAREVGCDTVLTFNRPEKYLKDCGTELAQMLGFSRILEEDADLYKKNREFLEAEACCSGDMGSFVVFLAHEANYKDKLLFMGSRGDSIWAKNHGNVNDDYDFSLKNGLVQSNISYLENALKNNMVMIHVPLIGAACWKDVHQISVGQEMMAYSVGGNYDRPIPRKIVEDEGVPRESFGQEKKGAGVSFHFDTRRRLKRRMSPASFEAFERYARGLQPAVFSSSRDGIIILFSGKSSMCKLLPA